MRSFVAMETLPEPAYVTYRLVTTDDVNMHIRLIRSRGSVWFDFPPGAANADLRIMHRRSDPESLIIDGSGERYLTPRAFFDPTWAGSYNAMRDGMFFWGYPVQPTVGGVPTPTPSPSPVPGMTTIAVESAATSTLYDISDAGVETCENGDPGRALNFKARRDPERYQLTYAVVDTARNLFCALRFTVHPTPASSLSDLEFYSEVNNYWVRTSGVFESISSNMRMIPVIVADPYMGATTQYHPHFDNADVKLRYRLVQMTFPSKSVAGYFTPPPS